METTSAAPHICPDCASRLSRLEAMVSQLEEDNHNLRQLEEAMRRKNGWFAGLLANSTEGVLLTGPGRRILRVVRGLSGYVPGEIEGVLLESLVVPEDQHILLKCYRDLLDGTCGQTEFEVRVPRPDGTILHACGTLTDMLDNPDVQAIVANFSDVTGRRDKDLAMAEFRVLMERSEDAVFSKDPQGRILTWNDGAQKMFGFSADEITRRHISVLLAEERRAEEEEARRLAIETGTAREFETEFVDKSGVPVAVLCCLEPVLDRYGRARGIVNLTRRVRPGSGATSG